MPAIRITHWLAAAAIVTLLLGAIGCEKTITEPGEPPHGGAFLYGSPSNAPTTR